MQIKKIHLTSLLVLLTASFTASAGDALFRPRASLGYASYELAFTNSGSSLADSSYMTGGVGASIAMENLYFDVAYNSSLSATYDNGGIDDNFERTDLSLTMGITLDGGLSVFGGYKTGESIYSDTDPFSTASELTFTASGLFIGAGFSTAMEDSSLSFNVSIAFLEGELKDNDTFYSPYDATADTVGLSLGLGYNYYLDDTSGFGLKGAIQAYNFVDWVDDNWVVDDTTESLISMEASYFVNF